MARRPEGVFEKIQKDLSVVGQFSKTPDRLEHYSVFVGLLLMSVTLRFEISGDGALRYRMLQALVDEHRILSDYGYSLLQCIGALPLYVVGKSLRHPINFVERFNLLFFSGMMLAAWRRLSPLINVRLLRRWCLLMLVCSMFPHHLRMFYTEVFSTAGVVIGLVCLVTNAPFIGAASMSLGVIDSPVLMLPLMLVTLKLSWDSKGLWYWAIPAVSILGIMLEAWIRRGSPFLTGYENNHGFQTLLPYSGLPGFSYPFILGALSILFSFGKGLLFFTPGLLLSYQGSERKPYHLTLARLQSALLIFVAGMVVAYAKWWAWYGGFFWGPRFFLLASVPASLALAFQLQDTDRSLSKNVLVLGVLLLSAWVGIEGAIFGQDGLERIGAVNNYALESLVWYVPEFSPLWYPLVAHHRLLRRDMIIVGYSTVVTAWLAAPLLKQLAGQLDVRLRTLIVDWKNR